MTTSKAPSRNRAPLNLAMGLVGLACVVVLTVNGIFEWTDALAIPLGLLIFLVLVVMYFTRRSDEYTLELWSAGANAAFGVMLLSLILGPFVYGISEGFNAAHEGREAEFDFPWSLVPSLAIMAFFLTFNIKRLTGAM